MGSLPDNPAHTNLKEDGDIQELDAGHTVDSTANPPIATIGKDLLEQWETEGVLGLFADRPDSPEYARQLRNARSNRAGVTTDRLYSR